MSNKNIVVEKTELVIDALDYAFEHDLDVSKKEDVKKILEVIDPTHTSEKEVNEFMNLLQNADTFMEMTARKKTEKINLPN